MVIRLVIPADDNRPVLRILRKLNNPDPILRQIGAIMTATSQKSFQDQGLGDFKWAPRYPNQGEPFVNIAGLLGDLNKGGTIKGRRFVRRPALIDTGRLRMTINSRISGKNSVETGTPVEYASLHQFGGSSSMPVTDRAKRGLAKFLKSSRGKQYRSKLGFLFSKTTLETQVGQRPFIGITDESERAMVRVVEEAFRG